MKNLIMICALLVPFTVSAQFTLNYRNVVDIIATPNASGDSARYDVQVIYANPRYEAAIDSVIMDTATVNYSYVDSLNIVNEAFSVIERSQNVLAGAERILLDESALNADLIQVNQVLSGLSGQGFFQFSYELIPIVQGFWSVRANGTNYLFTVDNQGNAVQVDNQGNVIGGGITGRFRIRARYRIELVNFTPAELNGIHTAIDISIRKYQELVTGDIITYLQEN